MVITVEKYDGSLFGKMVELNLNKVESFIEDDYYGLRLYIGKQIYIVPGNRDKVVKFLKGENDEV